MQRFEVDDDLVELVWEKAKPKPFETLSFSAALRRVLVEPQAGVPTPATKVSLDDLVARAKARAAAMPKKAPSPSAAEWAASVPELKRHRALANWKSICDALNIDPAGDSARRKLKAWVSLNRPTWPEVPDV